MIEDEADMQIIAEASNAEEALTIITNSDIDVGIFDLRLPDYSGIELAEKVNKLKPGLNLMILSSFLLEEEVNLAFNAGVLGYVTKDTNGNELIEIIRHISQGNQYLSPEVILLLDQNSMGEYRPPLSNRELEILQIVAKGQSNKEIAHHLGLSENTIKNHIKSILVKLDANDRTHAVSEGLKKGLFHL